MTMSTAPSPVSPSPVAEASTAEDPPTNIDTMRSIVQDEYCAPSDLELREIGRPVPGPDQVLVRVEAAGVNIADWYRMSGQRFLVRTSEGLRRPKRTTPGADLAGVVEAVGSDVTDSAVGDEVFGEGVGAYAEYAAVGADVVVPKAPNATFEQAAAVPIAGFTALQGIRDHGEVKSGQRVLIIGAGGGIGTYGVQIAKSLGADVTGVCSTAKVDLVRSLGADRVVDYTTEDFVEHGPFDVIIDIVGTRSTADLKRALTDDGIYVMVGAPRGGRIFGPLKRFVGALASFAFASQKAKMFMADPNQADLRELVEMMEAGTLVSVVDRTYPLAESAAALDHVEGGHATGKVVILPTR